MTATAAANWEADGHQIHVFFHFSFTFCLINVAGTPISGSGRAGAAVNTHSSRKEGDRCKFSLCFS